MFNLFCFFFNETDVVILPENERWLDPDVDYTSSTTGIYAVWPTLRNDMYEWALVQDAGAYEFQIQDAPEEPCQHPTVIKCGNTGTKLQLFVYSNVFHIFWLFITTKK